MKKTIIITILILVGTIGVAAQASGTYSRPNAETRFKRYLLSAGGPYAIGAAAAGSAFGTMVDYPKEWGRSADGFGRRFASNFGKNAAASSIVYVIDEAAKLDSHFYKSKKRDFGSRVANAVLSTFTARTASGKRTIGISRIAGSYGGDMLAKELWYPSRYRWRDGFTGGTISIGINVMTNLIREFVGK